MPAAVSNFDGAASFHVNSDNATSSLLPIDEVAASSYVGVERFWTESVPIVPVMRLDTFLDAAGIASVQFLSIDAQGSDLAVIESLGERIRDVESVRIEAYVTAPQYVGAHNSEQAVMSVMTGLGFELVRRSEIVYGQQVDLSFVRPGSGAA